MRSNVRFVLVASIVCTALSRSTAAQEPTQGFSYDNIRFSGIQVEAGVITSKRLKGAPQIGLRVDLGQFAPRVRLMAGVSYFRSDFTSREIGEFESALERVVSDPEGNFTIDLGRVRWSDVALDVDFQYLLGSWGRWQPYLGLGAGAHIRNGSGAAINGTFVEDALDNIGAGINVTAGWDVSVAPGFILNVGGRAVLASDVSTLGLQVGLGYRRARRGS